jgi:hypothetical protein
MAVLYRRYLSTRPKRVLPFLLRNVADTRLTAENIVNMLEKG